MKHLLTTLCLLILVSCSSDKIINLTCKDHHALNTILTISIDPKKKLFYTSGYKIDFKKNNLIVIDSTLSIQMESGIFFQEDEFPYLAVFRSKDYESEGYEYVQEYETYVLDKTDLGLRVTYRKKSVIDEEAGTSSNETEVNSFQCQKI